MSGLTRRNFLRFSAVAGLAAATGVAGSACAGVGGGGGAEGGKASVRYAWWGNAVRQQNFTKALQQFSTANPEITMEPEFAEYAAFQERMTTQMAARNVPEIFWIAAPQVLTYDKSGIYHDIEGVDSIKLDDFSAEDLESFKLKGKLNTVPFAIFVPVFRYNVDEAKKAGVTFPADGPSWNWDALAELAIDYSKDSKLKGLAYNADADLPFEAWLRQRGEQLWTEDGKVGFTADGLGSWLDWWEKVRKGGGCLTISEQDGVTADWSIIGNKVLANMGNSNHIIDDAKLFPEASFKLRHLPVRSGATAGWQYLYTPRMAIYSGIDEDKLAAAGSMVNHQINDVSMLKTVGLTMGAPTNPRLAKEVLSFASANEKDMLAIVAADRALDRRPRYEAPAGSSTWRTVLSRTCEEVALGKASVPQASAKMIAEISAGIDRAAG